MHRGSTTAARRAAPLARHLVLLLCAALIALAGALTAAPEPAAAAGPKVVIVVGPSSSATSSYLSRAHAYADEARSLGATVVEVDTPHATWSRVQAAAQGARVLIYLGHGNGWPSPYTSSLTPDRQDGFGLNPVDGQGIATPVAYYGESVVAAGIRLAPGAVVLLNHLCYASGAGESGMPNPSWAVARERVDNFAAGFIGAGASAVLADAHDVSAELRLALSNGQNLLAGWRASPNAQGNERSFASLRRPGYTNYLDPDNPGDGFYRALTTKPSFVTGTAPVAPPIAAPFAPVPLTAVAQTAAIIRSSASVAAGRVATVARGASLSVIGALRHDAAGRTWAPVRTTTGRNGWVAAWLLQFRGSAASATSVVLRKYPSAATAALATVPANTRVTVAGTRADARDQVWLSVRLASGRTGWVAAWLMKP